MTRMNGWDASMLGLGVAALAASAADAARGTVPAWEERSFRAVNTASPALTVLWPVMQFGSLAAVPLTALATDRLVDRPHAVRVGAAGGVAWLAAKVVKAAVGRGRPADLLDGVELREGATGLGFVSGHAAVATAMTALLAPRLAPLGRGALLAAACWVPVGRMFVGAHLPHDVIGGFGLGLVVGATVRALTGTGAEAATPPARHAEADQ